MFMNQFEIEAANYVYHDCPNVRKGVRLLLRLMRSVNEQSDGWCYWSPPWKSAQKLVELLKTTGNLCYGTQGTITEAQLRRAISPIRAMVTRESKRQKRFGNTFVFDVDAALRD